MQSKIQNNGRHVIAIPELLAMIVHELDNREQRKLMYISKDFFHSLGPIAWKSVPRVDLVMRLIEGVQFKCLDNGYIYWVTIRFPLNPKLGRYTIYAPWVQELEIYGRSYEVIEENLDSFVTLLNNRPPLPNLRRLTASIAIPIEYKYFMNILGLFIHPLLTEIRAITPEPGHYELPGTYIPLSSAPAFLEKLKTTCPEIQTLEFYLKVGAVDISEEFTLSNQLHTLSSLVNLRSFGSGAYILEYETLAVLGELPYLESLRIRRMRVKTPFLDKQLSIPETWFPVLKDLRLDDIHHQDMQVLWNQPTIVSKLVSAHIRTGKTYLAFEDNYVYRFLKSLDHLSPRLRDVLFSIGYGRERIDVPRDHWDQLQGGFFSSEIS